VLQFCPTAPEEAALRAKFSEIGISPGVSFALDKLSEAQKAEVLLGMKEGYNAVEKRAGGVGTDVNGWRVGSALGDRAFFHGDYLLRAAGALLGIYGNDAAEATYPLAKTDGTGAPLDGCSHKLHARIFGRPISTGERFLVGDHVRWQNPTADREPD
jgi:hypothetical protein